MFENQSLARQRETFAKQFAPDGDTFVYRRSQRGAGYRVTAAERDAFVAAYRRRQKSRYGWFIGLLIVGICASVAVAVMLNIDPEGGPYTLGFIGALIVFVAVFLFAMMRDFTAPARELARRTPTAAALTTDERRHQTLSQLTWQRLGIAALTMLAVPWMGSRGHPFEGWNKVWVALAGAGLVFVAAQSFRKWRFDQEH